MNEDLDYNFPSDAVAPRKAKQDIDYNNKSVLVQVLAEIDRLIEVHNSKDSLDLTKSEATLKVQVRADKQFVGTLRGFREFINNKVEELVDGR